MEAIPDAKEMHEATRGPDPLETKTIGKLLQQARTNNDKWIFVRPLSEPMVNFLLQKGYTVKPGIFGQENENGHYIEW